MASQDFKRKLTAILSADVKGYSRLMRDDEEATVRTITTYREVIGSVVRKHRGEVVDSPGDNILAEFASVVDAVRGAVEIQEELKIRNAGLPENRRMEFRIGINLGDVIHEEKRIYGDGVNVAARVESLADAGGICVSRSVFNQVKDKLTLGYEYLGEHSVKNIAEPVRVYRVLMDPEAAGKVIGEERVEPKRGLRVALAAVIVLLLVVGGLLIWRTVSPPVEVASKEKMAFPLPEKPSLAVLPFDNLSGDSSQDYFSDGITETIITNLSNVSNLFVIARNSTFTYKGKPVKVQQVAEELGVRYVLEGSVQRSEDSVRITAQLIDALTGHHLWAENYDRKLGDIFALQDDITEHVTMALKVKLTEGEQARIRRRDIENKEAYEYFLRGLEIFRTFTKEANTQGRKLFEKTVELDPNSSAGWCHIGWAHYRDGRFGWTDTPDKSLALAEEQAHKILAMDDSMAEAHSLLSMVYMARKQHDKAVAYGEKALALAPNYSDITANTAVIFFYSGRPEEAIELIKKAMRLSPYYPSWYLPILGLSYRLTGQYKEAIAALEGFRDRKAKGMLPHIFLAFTYIEASREEDAHAAVAEALKQNPKASVSGYAATIPYKDPAEIERVKNSLRKAGLPETPPLPLPDKPSIAVLPFENMSGDPKQEYFSDGITEDIITSLSKTDRLFVIARSSSFTYKGKPVKVQKISRELGVKYVLEGSVQKDENRLRITAQLIDATTGTHVWAERYDRELKDVFALQDDIAMKILSALQIKLTHGEQARVWSKGTDNLEAYLKLMQGHENFIKMSIKGNPLARQMAEETISLDPKYADAYSLLGKTHIMDVFLGLSKSPKDSIAKALGLLQKAIALDNTSADARTRIGILYTMMRKHDQGIAEMERATAFNPNFAPAYFRLGWILRFSGMPDEGIPAIKKAMRLNPFPPNYYLWSLATCYLYAGKCGEAIDTCEKILQGEVNSHLSYVVATVVYSMCGREEKAKESAKGVLKMNPKFSCSDMARSLPYKNKDDLDRYIAALQKAGLK
jgi:adenylate cyclase